MYVNPIAFGVVCTIIAEIVIAILYGMIRSLIAKDDEEEEIELAPEVKAELRKQINSIIDEREGRSSNGKTQ